MDKIQVCLCECARTRVCVCVCWEDSSRSQFYEWKESICHFFAIFGHRVAQRESFVYVAENKMWQ